MKEERHKIEILIGPCSREKAERLTDFLQNAADMNFPDVGAAVSAQFNWEDDKGRISSWERHGDYDG